MFFLGKCFGAEYYIDRYQGTSADLRDDLNAFYEKHSAWGCESATDEQKAKSLDEWGVPLPGRYIHENQFDVVYEARRDAGRL